MPHKVYDMDFDEVSTVDVPANQHGLIVLAKRDNQEDQMADYFDAEGNAIDGDPREVLDVGDQFQDASGQVYEITAEDETDELVEDGRELEAVGKSAFFLEALSKREDEVLKSLSSELAKAATDEQREAVLAKALAVQSTELSKAQAQAEQAYSIAKAAQDRELERQYIAKAGEYDVPADPEELGPVLKRMSEKMSYDDCAVIHKTLVQTGAIFEQLGVSGGAEGGIDDPFDVIEDFANEAGEVAKSAGREAISKEAALVAHLNNNPGAYGQLRRQARNG